MVDAIVSYALEKIGDFLIQKATFHRGVRGDVEWLKNELEPMKAFLRDAENKQDADDRVRWWIAEIRDISQEAITILERFDVKVKGQRESKDRIMAFVQSYVCCYRKQADLYDIGKEIESLKKRVLGISQKCVTYGIRDINLSGEGTSGTSQSQMVQRATYLRRTTSSFAVEVNVIGFKDVIQTLRAQLLKEEASRLVVSIYGMGGLGKTTIASKLYHSLTGFDCKAWVCVSEDYNNQDLLQCIIKSFQGQLTEQVLKMLKNMTETDLERHLRQILEGRRYLLVIDDAWGPEAWQSLKRALPENKNGSRVILTTRNKDVASQASRKQYIHALPFLTIKESWDLFRDKVFQEIDTELNDCSPDMETLAWEMVEKCGGLPLAIIVLAGILSHKDGLDEWREVKEHIWENLEDDCVHISQLFSLSYNDLPPELQNCFLYTGMFPEDYVIDVKKLIRLWIAEELLPQEVERKEDLAEKYFNELINRSLLQGAGRFWEEIVKCKVHDLLRDLAIQKAKEVKFFDIYDHQPKYSSSSGLYKRHAIHGNIKSYMSLCHSNMKLQTQVFFCQDGEMIGLHEVMSECLKFKSMEVLDLQGIKLSSGNLSKALGELIHLKFLGLSETRVGYIPSEIGNLKYLQTLDVMSNFYSCTLPTEICELKELRYLYGCFKEGSISFKNPSKLLTLGVVEYDTKFEASTIHLGNLRELTLCYPSSLNFTRNLINLATLILVFKDENDLHVSLQPLMHCKCLRKLWLDGGVNLPTFPEFPPSLTRLILVDSKLLHDPMPTLEKLPNLRSLELQHAYQGKKMVCGVGGFPQLEVLRLRSLNSLKEWKVEKGAMPRIRGLRITNCESLKKIPRRIRSVPRVVKSESIYCMPPYLDLDDHCTV